MINFDDVSKVHPEARRFGHDTRGQLVGRAALAAERGVTIRAQLLRALKNAGYEIREEDIGDDRRKA